MEEVLFILQKTYNWFDDVFWKMADSSRLLGTARLGHQVNGYQFWKEKSWFMDCRMTTRRSVFGKRREANT